MGYKFYITEYDIFWNRLNENKPSKSLFEEELKKIEWKEVDFTPNYIDQVTATLVVDKDTYTYFIIVDEDKKFNMYFFVMDILRKLNNGFEIQLTMDIHNTYIHFVLENLSNKNPYVLFDRAHTKVLTNGDTGRVVDWLKYMFNYEDNLIKDKNLIIDKTTAISVTNIGRGNKSQSLDTLNTDTTNGTFSAISFYAGYNARVTYNGVSKAKYLKGLYYVWYELVSGIPFYFPVLDTESTIANVSGKTIWDLGGNASFRFVESGNSVNLTDFNGGNQKNYCYNGNLDIFYSLNASSSVSGLNGFYLGIPFCFLQTQTYNSFSMNYYGEAGVFATNENNMYTINSFTYGTGMISTFKSKQTTYWKLRNDEQNFIFGFCDDYELNNVEYNTFINSSNGILDYNQKLNFRNKLTFNKVDTTWINLLTFFNNPFGYFNYINLLPYTIIQKNSTLNSYEMWISFKGKWYFSNGFKVYITDSNNGGLENNQIIDYGMSLPLNADAYQQVIGGTQASYNTGIQNASINGALSTAVGALGSSTYQTGTTQGITDTNNLGDWATNLTRRGYKGADKWFNYSSLTQSKSTKQYSGWTYSLGGAVGNAIQSTAGIFTTNAAIAAQRADRLTMTKPQVISSTDETLFRYAILNKIVDSNLNNSSRMYGLNSMIIQMYTHNSLMEIENTYFLYGYPIMQQIQFNNAYHNGNSSADCYYLKFNDLWVQSYLRLIINNDLVTNNTMWELIKTYLQQGFRSWNVIPKLDLGYNHTIDL